MTPSERNPDGTFAPSGDDDEDTTVSATGDDTGDEESRDEDGSLIDPPNITAYERELQEAHASGDNDTVAEVQERYTEAREEKSRTLRDRARDNEDGE